MKVFHDIENDFIVTEKQLYTEFVLLKTAQPDEYNYSFNEFINNCLTIHNGTLQLVR